MDANERAAKLALARKKLKDHQEKKNHETIQKTSLDPDHSLIGQESPMTEQNEDVINLTKYSSENNLHEIVPSHEIEVNATEFLISSKRNLELQLIDLQNKNTELENNLVKVSDRYETSCQKVFTLENEIKNIHFNYSAAIEQIQAKDALIKELRDSNATVLEEKTNLQEQLEFTKTFLNAKETENDSLHSQLYNIQSQLDSTQLHLQQLTSGGHDPNHPQSLASLRHDNETLLHKVTSLEQQLKSQLKDYQQINSHYEHYVGELNEQLKSVTRKNEDLNKELLDLSNRESGLIEQIGEMEIRLQNYKRFTYQTSNENENTSNKDDMKELQDKYEKVQENLQQINHKYEELQRMYSESNAIIDELNQPKELQHNSDNDVSLLKLNADIASDKLAAQRATEQNRKLKLDLQGLEEALVKMTKDKLELTEKVTAEKYLNRELTIKLAEIDEKANALHNTLKAKDEEMIRLQNTYRSLEAEFEELKNELRSKTPTEQDKIQLVDSNKKEKTQEKGNLVENGSDHHCPHNDSCENQALIQSNPKQSGNIPNGDAMLKLQDRFLKIMEEVADLSDEKHRLEHIIMQLQNETDTICEYVALYQQQRSLLKKRDEERSAQIEIYQSECNRLQNQLDELTGILKRFSEDKELSSYFQIQAKYEDLQKVMSLLANLKTSSLLDPLRSIENSFYPCSCCSGQLIDV